MTTRAREDSPAKRDLPGAVPPAWLGETLFARRIVLVTGRLDDAVASRAAAELMALDATAMAPVDLFLDCPDGTLEAAFVLIDTLDGMRATVRAHCRGQAGGPAVGVVAVAARRSAAPHARFRLGQPTVALSGTPAQVAAATEQQRDSLVRFHARLASATGRPVAEIAADMRIGRYLDAREALAYGLIDTIGKPA